MGMSYPLLSLTFLFTMSKAPDLAPLFCSVAAFVCSLMDVSSDDVPVSAACESAVTDVVLCCMLQAVAANTTEARTASANALIILIGISS